MEPRFLPKCLHASDNFRPRVVAMCLKILMTHEWEGCEPVLFLLAAISGFHANSRNSFRVKV